MASLAGKVILLTGASAGIGSATASYLARFKPRLALVGRGAKGLRDTIRQCQATGLCHDQLFPVEADLLRDSELERIVKSVVDTFGRIDVLVNNAGVAIFSDLLGTKMATWDHMMAINVRAPFLLTKLCLPYLVDTKGCVINLSSVQGQIGMPQSIAYSMGKAALDHFSRTLAADVGRHNVRVNTVSPGFTVSGIHLNSGMTPEVYKEYTEAQAAMTPLGRCCQPLDIAKVIAFLATDDAAFVTGETIRVDGGRGVVAPVLRSMRERQENSEE